MSEEEGVFDRIYELEMEYDAVKNKQLSLWLNFIERKWNGPLSFSTGYQKFKPISPFGSLKILAIFHPCNTINKNIKTYSTI